MRTSEGGNHRYPQPMWIGPPPLALALRQSASFTECALGTHASAGLRQVQCLGDHLMLLSKTSEADLMRKMSSQISVTGARALAMAATSRSRTVHPSDDNAEGAVGWKLTVVRRHALDAIVSDILRVSGSYKEGAHPALPLPLPLSLTLHSHEP